MSFLELFRGTVLYRLTTRNVSSVLEPDISIERRYLNLSLGENGQFCNICHTFSLKTKI